MNSGVNRGDLLQFLAHHQRDELAEVLDCFGYKRRRAAPQKQQLLDEPVKPDGELKPLPDEKKQPKQPQLTRPAEYFYKLSDTQPSSVLPEIPQEQGQQTPEWVRSINNQPLDIYDSSIRRDDISQPAFIPLVSWSRLWPLLRQILSHTQTHQRPDIDKLVKQVAKGDELRRIPKQQRKRWFASAILLLDQAKRLNLMYEDYQALEQQLQRLRGKAGLTSYLLDAAPGGHVIDSHNDQHPWRMPSADTPIVILSDLGVYERSGEVTKQWLGFGRALKTAGCTTYVLVPGKCQGSCRL